jgi:hypothetical protein
MHHLNKLIILLVLLGANIPSSLAQDKINLLNGGQLTGNITDTTSGNFTLKYLKRKKEKMVTIENYRIFSYNFKDKPETVLYKQDSTIGNFFTVEEMNMYVLGERDAQKNYNPVGLKITSCLLAYGLTVADTYKKDTTTSSFFSGFFNSQPGIISIVAPFALTALAGIPAVQIDIAKVSNRNYLNSQAYVDGFERIGRSKKVFGALKFSIVGSLAGLATYYIGSSIKK